MVRYMKFRSFWTLVSKYTFFLNLHFDRVDNISAAQLQTEIFLQQIIDYHSLLLSKPQIVLTERWCEISLFSMLQVV